MAACTCNAGPVCARPTLPIRARTRRSSLALKNDCRTVDRACLALLEANDKPIRETLAAQAVTLAHYRELIALTGWQAPFPPRYDELARRRGLR
ncbi:hypothetical protein LP420_09800 [Massilia sp. B-10]|nr:hypothetical protein LP420_09800 [Massilia sp. B-10]